MYKTAWDKEGCDLHGDVYFLKYANNVDLLKTCSKTYIDRKVFLVALVCKSRSYYGYLLICT